MKELRKSRPRTALLAVLVVSALVAGTVLALTRGAGSSKASGISFRVDKQVNVGGRAFRLRIQSGVTPRMTPAQVQALVLDKIGPAGQVTTMSVVATEADAAALEPQSGDPLGEEAALGPVWVVRGAGKFEGLRTPPGTPPRTAGTGYYMIDDNTGEGLGMGLP